MVFHLSDNHLIKGFEYVNTKYIGMWPEVKILKLIWSKHDTYRTENSVTIEMGNALNKRQADICWCLKNRLVLNKHDNKNVFCSLKVLIYVLLHLVTLSKTIW